MMHCLTWPRRFYLADTSMYADTSVYVVPSPHLPCCQVRKQGRGELAWLCDVRQVGGTADDAQA